MAIKPPGLSLRAIARSIKEHGSGVSQAHLSRLVRGVEVPSRPILEAIAAELDVDPEYFVEYWLAVWRVSLDVRGPGGFEAAIATLEHLEAVAKRPAA